MQSNFENGSNQEVYGHTVATEQINSIDVTIKGTHYQREGSSMLTNGQTNMTPNSAFQICSQISGPFSETRLENQNEISKPQSANQDFDCISDVSNRSEHVKLQELTSKAKEQEDVIIKLRKQLADCVIKEQRLVNEKRVLQRRVAEMRKAFDHQQQELVDAAARAIANRQSIIEENIHLSYALHEVEQDRYTFMSSLLPLLVEHSIQPGVANAYSVASSIRALVRGLHERVNLNEAKLTEYDHQMMLWQSDSRFLSSAPQSPLNRNEQYSRRFPGQLPASSPLFTFNDGSNEGHDNGIGNTMFQYKEPPGQEEKLQSQNEDLQFQFPDNSIGFDKDWQTRVDPTYVSTHQLHTYQTPDNRFEKKDELKKQNSELASPVQRGGQPFSVSDEDDPLPGITDLQIAGEAIPGKTIQACGHSVNGTHLCNFEWVRHQQDGTIFYIEGANQPDYNVTADDVDTILAVECVPIDEKNRKGELVKAYANNQNKITCDGRMKEEIEGFMKAGYADFDIFVLAEGSESWEPAKLILRRPAYEIKLTGDRLIIGEKYTPDLSVKIPYGYSKQCVLTTTDGSPYPLDTGEDIRLRDTLVLTLRMFQKRALDRRKSKQKVSFLNKIVA